MKPKKKRRRNRDSEYLPFSQVLYDRRTGKTIGNPLPIRAEDWPYSEPDGSEVLWRYLDLGKFKDMIETQTLFFCRQDKFEDPFEGRFSKANQEGHSKSDEAFYRAYDLDRPNETAAKQVEIHRSCVFISCWHRNSRENLEMWQEYTSGINSVVITTSVKALDRFLPKQIMKSPVKYCGQDFPRSQFGWNSLSFYKDEKYKFEREFRLLLNLGENESINLEDPDDYGRRLPIPLARIVHRVISHPRATEQAKQEIDMLLANHLKAIHRQNSAFEVKKK